jgi:hypothetical protein
MFNKGRNILDGSLALVEIFHELRVQKLGEVFLKLDFGKAYDKLLVTFCRKFLGARA